MKVRERLFVLSLGSLLSIGGVACSNDPTELQDEGSSKTPANDAGTKDSAAKRDARVVELTDDEDGDDQTGEVDDDPRPLADAGSSKADAGKAIVDGGKPVGDAGKQVP